MIAVCLKADRLVQNFWLVSAAYCIILTLVDSACPAALDVGGAQAREIFGKQWHKLMELLYGGLTEKSDSPIGGKTPEGTAARTRALLEVERVMNS